MDRDRDFDAIVVGAGMAGCVLAARLSEVPATGGLPGGRTGRATAAAAVPSAWPSLLGGESDRGVETRAGAFTGVRHHWAVGSGLGGSSAINAMTHMRGHHTSYDAWAEGWDFASMLPWFCATETAALSDASLRGHDGPMAVAPPAPLSTLAEALLAAAGELGIPAADDLSGGLAVGAGVPDVNIVDGRRQSAPRTPTSRGRPHEGT